MADSKISALTAASIPLAGTEVLPIVQSGVTVKVATDDLTVKNIRSNATTGLLQVAGPGTGTTRVMTTPNANFTSARTDAAQSFTGDQTLATGNLVQGTAGKGFNFNANTPSAGMTSQLINWYEEGTWTPTDGSGAGLVITKSSATYTRIGRVVTVQMDISYPSTVSGNTATISGLPFTSANNNGAAVYTNSASSIVGAQLTGGGINFQTVSGGNATNVQLSGNVIRLSCSYQV